MRLAGPENVMRRTATASELRAVLASLAPDAWLSDDECQQADSLRNDRRRQQWLSGRWLAKQLISQYLEEVRGRRSEVGVGRLAGSLASRVSGRGSGVRGRGTEVSRVESPESREPATGNWRLATSFRIPHSAFRNGSTRNLELGTRNSELGTLDSPFPLPPSPFASSPFAFSLSPLSLRSLYIQSHDGTRRATRPRVFVDGRLQAWSLSISHTEHLVSAALVTQPGLSVGVDLAVAGPLPANVLRMWFTATERRWLDEAGGAWCPQQLWAAKEATFKAISRGERFAPRQLEIYGNADRRLICRWRDTDVTAAWHLDVKRIEDHHFVLATVVSR